MNKKLLLSGRTSIDNKMLKQAALDAGWQVEQVINYKYEPEPDEDLYLYGPVLWTDVMCEKLSLRFDDAPLDLLHNLPMKLRGRSVNTCESSYIERSDPFIQNKFIKPARDKTFEPFITPIDKLPETFYDSEYVIVSDVVKFKYEVRCYFLKNNMVTLSPYMKDMQPIEIINPDETYWGNSGISSIENYELLKTVRAVEDYIVLPKTIVIDLGMLENGQWVVVEANNVINSGLYDCDPDVVLECIEKSKRAVIRRRRE